MSASQLTITQQAAALRSREVSAVELAGAALAHVEAHDSRLNAYLTVTADAARQQAAAADRRLREDGASASPLCGVPVAIKDVLCIDGVETTAGSKILKGFVPPYTATSVQRLLDAGAVVVGKTNCDEFAMGSSNENSAYGPAGNPWDVERVPGGSSGGSAAAVASGGVAYSLGSDTGGSIRQPAALCGVAGFKPTYGRVSRYGLIAFASSLDQVGPFAHSVRDCATVFATIGGHDPLDSTSEASPVEDPLASLDAGVRGMRFGVPKEYFGAGVEPGVRDRVEAAMRVIESLGGSLEEVSLPSTDVALSTYYIIAPAECSSNLARMDGVRFGHRVDASSLTDMYLRTRDEGFGPEVKRRIMLGNYALSSGYYDAYYKKAQQVRTLVAREFESVFTKVDALVCPTSPIVAFRRGERSDPLAMYACDTMTIPVNLAGLPGISVPCGFVDSLPVGLQFIAPRLEDAKLLRVAYAYEQATEWHEMHAPMVEATA